MAGPFSSRGNQATEIEGVQLQGGFAPVPGIVDAVNAAAKVALPAIRENHIQNLEEDVTGKTDSIKTALLARSNPALAQSLFTEEALANPATAAAFAQFNDIALAVKQGKLPGQFALERLSVIQSDAISQSPEFEQEIRAAMIQATGQDPQKRLFSKLLSDQAQGLTAQEKFDQKITFDAARVGLTVPAFVEANNAVFLAQAEEAEFKRSKVNDTINLRKVAGAVNNRSGLIMLDVMQAARLQIKTAGGLTPEFTTQLQGQVSASIAAATAEVIATAGDAVDPTEIASAIAPLEALSGQIDAMIEDGSLLTMVNNTNVLNKGLILGEAMQFKDFAIAHSLGGERGFVEVLKFFDKATNPKTRALLDALNPSAARQTLLGEAAGGVELVPSPTAGGVVKAFGRLGNGVDGLSIQQTNERILAANIAIQTIGGNESAHTAAMSDLEAVSPAHAWTAYDNRKVIAASLQSKTLQAKFIPLQAQQTAGLATEYFNLSGMGGFRADKFSFVGGQLQFKAEFAPLTPQGARSEFDKLAPAFVRRFNQANKISSMYSRVGILPASRYTNSTDYFNVISTAVQEELEDESQGKKKAIIVRWGRDANGKPIRITE